MKPLDDLLPQEGELEQQELLAMLQQAFREPASLTVDEQQEAIARVRARLLSADHLSEEEIPAQRVGTAASTPLASISSTIAPRRRRRFVSLLNSLAAVLVIGAIIGASLLLFTHHPSSLPARPASTPNSTGGFFTYLPIVASSSADGLEMTVAMTPGPYFLSELLAVGITLTNHSQKAYTVGIPFVGSPCGYETGLSLSGGEKPYFGIPISIDHSCPGDFGGVAFRPGKTLSALVYFPLMASGHVSLESYAEFFINGQDPRNPHPRPLPEPPFKSWPTVRFDVSQQVPAGHVLSFKLQGTHVIVTLPPGAQPPLLYLYGVTCQDFNNDLGSTGTGSFGWYPISGTQVVEPGCPGKNIKWSFAFGVPGYGVAVGKNY